MKLSAKLAVAGVVLCSGWSWCVQAQEMMDYLKQDGLIADDTPLGFKSAKEASDKIPKDASFSRRNAPQMEAAGITEYSRQSERWTSWWVFARNSPFYPSVVRRRVVNLGDHAEVRTSILCSASKQSCDEITARFDAMDHVCGAALPSCKH